MKQEKRQGPSLGKIIGCFSTLLLLLLLGFQSGYCFSGLDCRGFDFLREFPESRGNKPSGVYYEVRRKQLTGVDGVYYHFQRKGKKSLMHLYTEDLPYSAREERYIAAYEKMEEEFDRKYAGRIKEQIREIGIQRFWEATRIVEAWKKDKRWDGTGFIYPAYLEGKEVPEGLSTPLIVLSRSFYSYYIAAKGKSGDLRDFILSTSLSKSAHLRDYAGYVIQVVPAQVNLRLKAVSAEYVLSAYYNKEYASKEERQRVVAELAHYYGNVAFRGAAEALYHSSHVLNRRQRCQIADYVAERVASLIRVIESPQALQAIREEYAVELASGCAGKLTEERVDRLYDKGEISKKERLAFEQELRQKVASGKEGCRDD